MTTKPFTSLALLVVASFATQSWSRTTVVGSRVNGTNTVHVASPTGQVAADRASILTAIERARPGDTIQFATGTYLVGEIIRVPTARLTVLGHQDGTTLRGCDPATYEERVKEIVRLALQARAGRAAPFGAAMWAGAARCGILELTGGGVAVRNLTFEHTGFALILGGGFAALLRGERAGLTSPPVAGGHQIEGNAFRNAEIGIVLALNATEPTVIRGNRFVNTFHALEGGGSHLHVLNNDISVPEPGLVPGRGHPGFAISVGTAPPDPTGKPEPAAKNCEHVVEGNRIDGHPDGIIILAAPGTTCHRNVVRNNTITVRRVRFAASDPYASIDFPKASGTDSTVVGIPLALVSMRGGSAEAVSLVDNVVEGNRVSGAEGIGIEIFRAARNRIVHNTIIGIKRRDPFPGNANGDPQRWREANGSGIWVSPGSTDNEIRENTFTDIAAAAVVLEGDSNRVDVRSARDIVRDKGNNNRVSKPRPLTLSLAATAAAGTADSFEYVVLHRTGPAGEMRAVIRGDTVLVRDIQRRSHRGEGPRQQARYVLGVGGSLRAVEMRSLSPAMEPTAVNESFSIVGRSARWRSTVDSGTTPIDGPRFYHVRTDTPYGTALLAAFLLRQPNETASLLPAGSARAMIAADTTLVVESTARRLRLVMIEGLGLDPTGVWLDERGTLFSQEADHWHITVRRGAEAVLPILRGIEHAYRARAADLLARRLAPPRSNGVVIRNGDVFDSERAVILPRTTVVIEGERIVGMGPADSIAIPAGARVIEATGKTILPGLWDMHTHNGTGSRAVLSLAAGVTTIRDMGMFIDVATAWRARADAGTVISPRVLLAGFMDGPGEAAGPGEAIVTTPDEARRWVARYDSLGYRQIKLYNLVHPILISAIADEAKKRGMRLSGHLPIGVSVQAAVHLGFDEIHHVMHLVSGLYPDAVFIPRERAHASVALAVAPNFDVDAPRVTELISLLRAKGTVIDGTLNVEQAPGVLPDGSDPVFGPTLAWLPPLVRRGLAMQLRQSARAQALRAASPVYLRLLKRLYDAGVTIVPGTDPFPGLPYHGELEIYERAGIPAPNVLQIATIVPARVMNDDKDYGSIAVGKVADLVIVDGKPASRIQDLRRAELVVRAGRVYATRDLYAAAGLTPRWQR